MNKYIIPIVALLALAPLMPRQYGSQTQAYNRKTETSGKKDELFSLEVQTSNIVDEAEIFLAFCNDDKTHSLKEIFPDYLNPKIDSPLKTLIRLLDSYKSRDSLASEKIAPNPENGWLNFYQTPEAISQARLLDEKFTEKEISVKSDTESLKATITLKGQSFTLAPGYFSGSKDSEWRLR